MDLLVTSRGDTWSDPNMLKTDSGDKPPVIHVDSDAPLTGEEGETITEDLWGIYYKPDFHFGGVQGRFGTLYSPI